MNFFWHLFFAAIVVALLLFGWGIDHNSARLRTIESQLGIAGE